MRVAQLTSSNLAKYGEWEVPHHVIHCDLSYLGRVFDAAWRKGIIDRRIIVKDASRERFFPKDELDRQLAALKDWARDVTRFAWLTGWEQGEIFGLTWTDNYDADKGVLRFENRVFPVDTYDELQG